MGFSKSGSLKSSLDGSISLEGLCKEDPGT